MACGENTSSKLSAVPEGDALHRAALRLQPLVGQRLEVESPNPRAQATQVAPRVDGRVLESVEAVGKNLLLRFEGGVVVRSHLRMTGRWRVEPRGKARTGLPWLVLRGDDARGRALERAGARRSSRGTCGGSARTCSPTSSTSTLPSRGCAAPATARLGEALQDQRLVAGIGNMWMAEALWTVRVSPWLRVRRADDDVLRDAVAAARRLMRDALATGRPGASGLPPRRAAMLALRHDRPLARPGRRQPHGVLVPGLPGRRRAAGGVSRTDGGTRSAPAPDPARLLPRRVRLPRSRARGGRRAAVRVRGARPAAGARAVRVPAARARRSSRRARTRSRAGRRADRARRAAARARRGDLRARPRRAEADRGRGALPHRAARAPDLDRGGVRRLRLGRPRLRARLRRARALALRRAPRLRGRRAARRALGRRRRSSSAAGSGCAPRPPASSRTTGPRRRDCCPPASAARSTATAWSSCERGLEPGEEPPDAPAELADAVSAIRLATAAPVAAGPVLFERLDWRPFGIRPVLPIAATQPPGEPTRLDSFRGRARRATARAARRSPTPTRRSPRRSTAGSSRSSRTSRSAPSSCAARSPACSARPGRCVRPCCSATPATSGARSTRHCARSPRASRRRRAPRTRCGGRSSRRSGTATGPRSSARSTTRCSGCARARRSRSGEDSRSRDERRSAFGTGRSLASTAWTKPRVLERLDRIEALDRTRAAPGELLAELRGLLCEAEAVGAGAVGDAQATGRRWSSAPHSACCVT